ncbi:MAG: T9SS type A sorting domain-containing protein [Bacteroidales bacterium]|nr:T9SS type A sorting domain-containing protein [Bacteroidales bacterium]
MEKSLTLILMMAVFLFGSSLNANAQREVIIEGYPAAGGGNILDFVDVLTTAFDADAVLRETEPDVTYVLKRDHIYPNSQTIKNTFPLRVVAEDGTGAKPMILTWEKSEAKYDQLLEARADVYFENIYFNNMSSIGVTQSRSQSLNAVGIRGEFVGCVIYQDDGAAFTIGNDMDSCSIFIIDCFVHNCGTEGANDSNGRFLDVRAATYTDSVVIQNCTGDHLNGSFVRAGNSVLGYVKIDHITTFNSRSGNLSLQFPKEAVITNNIFKDAQMLGDVPSTRDTAITNPDLFHSVCIDFDSIWYPDQITIRNNNIFYSDEVKAMWAKYDTIYEPLRVNPMAMRALGPDSINAAFSEVIHFTTACGPPIAYIEGTIVDMTATSYPSQHCVGGDGGGYFPWEIDASYETTSVSYTAADDGYPLGDLNWWPELKTKWENGEVLEVKQNKFYQQVEVYPNPVTDILYIRTESMDNLNISFYDILGKELHTASFKSGSIEIDARQFPKGFCLYRITNDNNKMVQTGKILISR